MSRSVTKATKTLYKSSNHIFKKKQHGLYTETLNSLKCFTFENSFANLNKSMHTQCIKLWFRDVLPLMFDADDEIRSAALEAVSAFVPQLKFIKFQKMKIWNITNREIKYEYLKEIENLQSMANDNWYIIWCLLVQIVDDAIVRSDKLMNTFLNIIDRGFRSSDLKIHAESFVCLRMLVQIFAKHCELENPKRLQSICVPLQSCISKTAEIDENKFYVWWDLICQFYKNVDTIVRSVVEPFFFFCFGSMSEFLLNSYLNDENVNVPAKSHPKIKLMTIVAFNQFVGSNNKIITELNEQLQLTVPDGAFTYTNTFNVLTKMLTILCTEVTVLLTDREIFSVAEALDINRSMWMSLMSKMDCYASVETSKLIKENILALIAVQKHQNNHDLPLLIRDVVDVIGTCEQFPIDHLGSADQILAILRDHCDILLNNDIAFDDSNEQQHRIIKHIFTMEKFQHKPYYRNLIMDLIGFITKDLVTPMNRATVNYTVVASIWNAGAYTLIDFIKSNKPYCCDLEDGKKILLDYLVWPCENIEKFDYLQIHTTFEKLFNQILKLFHDNVNEIIELASTLIQAVLIVKYNVGIEKVAELFVKIIRPMKHDFDGSSKPYHTFCLIENIVKNSTKHRRIGDAVKQLVDEFMKFVVAMNYKSFFLSILNVKNVISELALLKDFDMKNITNLLWQKFCQSGFIEELKTQDSQKQNHVKKLVQEYCENEVTSLIGANWLNIILKICDKNQPISTPVKGTETPSKKTKATPSKEQMAPSATRITPSTAPRSSSVIDNKSPSAKLACLHDSPKKNLRKVNTPKKVEIKTPTRKSPRRPTKRNAESSDTDDDDEKPLKSRICSTPKAKKLAVAAPRSSSVIDTKSPSAKLASSLKRLQITMVDSPKKNQRKANTSKKVEIQTPTRKSPRRPATRNLESSDTDDDDDKSLKKRAGSTPKVKKLAAATESPIRLITFEDNQITTASPIHNTELLNDRLDSSPMQIVVRQEECEASTSMANKQPQIENDAGASLLATTEFTWKYPGSPPRSSIMRKQNESTPTPRSSNANESIFNILSLASPFRSALNNHKNLLTFTPELPSRMASPSPSILKRNNNSNCASPLPTPKRVSFPAIPVSSTKEFQLDEDAATNSPECIGQQSTFKNMLGSLNLSNVNLYPKVVMTRLENGTTIADATVDVASGTNLREHGSELMVAQRNEIRFDNEADMYKYAFSKLSLDEILEQHAAYSEASNYDTALVLTNKIINLSNNDDEVKQAVLEDFSDYAVQENSSEVVCRRLPINSILDFVFAKSKASQQVQTRVLTEVEQMLSSGGNTESNTIRLTGFLQKVLEENCLSSDAISKMIVNMFANRPKVETLDLLQNLQRLLIQN